MRIAHVTPHALDEPGLVTAHVRGIARLLAERGHEVVVVGPARRRGVLREGRERRAALAAGRSDALEPAAGEPLEVAVGPSLPVRGSGGGVRRVGLPVSTWVNASLVLRDGAFDVVHLHEPGMGAPLAAARRTPALVVATFHAAPPAARKRSGDALARADALLATSERVRAEAEARLGGSGWEVLPDGIALDAFAPGPRLDPPRIVVESGPDDRATTRAVCRALADSGAEVLLLAADRRPRPPTTGARGMVRAVHAPTAASRAAALAGSAGFLAGASTPAQVALEAMACGVPVAAAEGSPAAELIEHERNGLRYVAEDPELAAAVALRMLETGDLADLLLPRARATAAAYDQQRVADRLEALYAELAARRRSGPQGAPAVEGRVVLADLHMHTRHSHDSATDVEALLQRAVELGLGAIAVTDHNTIAGGVEAQALAAELELPLTVIVGSEVKTESQGEVIGLFLREEVPRGLSFAETVERIHAQGGLVYVPHPFDRMHSIPSQETLRRHLDDIDIFEICNGRLYFEADNDEAERFAQRYGLPAGAGSDAHVLEGLATASLSMPAFDGPEEFLVALRSAEVVRRSRSLLYLQGLKWVRQLARS